MKNQNHTFGKRIVAESQPLILYASMQSKKGVEKNQKRQIN